MTLGGDLAEVADESPGLGERLPGLLAHLVQRDSGVLGPALGQQALGELGLECDDLQVVALDVVQVGGEAQPLAGDGEVRGLPPGVVEALHQSPEPDRGDDHAGGDHAPDEEADGRVGGPRGILEDRRRPEDE